MLYIEKVRLVDEGTYTCECSNTAGSSSKEHRLGVHGEPGSPRHGGHARVAEAASPKLYV